MLKSVKIGEYSKMRITLAPSNKTKMSNTQAAKANLKDTLNQILRDHNVEITPMEDKSLTAAINFIATAVKQDIITTFNNL